jgi:hypothetical protein
MHGSTEEYHHSKSSGAEKGLGTGTLKAQACQTFASALSLTAVPELEQVRQISGPVAPFFVLRPLAH